MSSNCGHRRGLGLGVILFQGQRVGEGRVRAALTRTPPPPPFLDLSHLLREALCEEDVAPDHTQEKVLRYLVLVHNFLNVLFWALESEVVPSDTVDGLPPSSVLYVAREAVEVGISGRVVEGVGELED